MVFKFFSDCTTQSQSDVVFTVDDSTSVQRTNFNKVLTFIQNIVETLTIGNDDVLVGFTSFSNTVKHQFYLNKYTVKSTLLTQIGRVRYRGGGTDIAKALDAAYDDQFMKASNGARDGATKVLVLVTDGKAEGTRAITDMLTAAQKIRDAGIIILCVGIKSGVDMEQLTDIANDANRVFSASNFDSALSSIQASLITKTCEGKIVNTNTNKDNSTGNK